MTTQAPERAQVTGILKGISTDGRRTRFDIRRDDGRKYPDWNVDFFERKNGPGAPVLAQGQRYSFLVEVRRKQGDDGKEHTYYDYVEHSAAEGATAPTAAPHGTPGPTSPPTGAPRTAVPPRDLTAPERQPQDVHEHRTDRRTALMQAVELAGHQMQATGKKVDTYHVGQIAEWFARLLDGTEKVRPIDFRTGSATASDQMFLPEQPAEEPAQEPPMSNPPQAAPPKAGQAPAAPAAEPTQADAESLLARTIWTAPAKANWLRVFNQSTPAGRRMRMAELEGIVNPADKGKGGAA